MAETNYIHANAHFAFRSDTLTNWEKTNPVLLAGEFGVVTNGSETQKVKIGNGVTPWNELSWWKGQKGDKGDNYILSDNDKQEIATLVDLPEVDQSYNAESKNAQSGIAIAEAIGQNNAQIDKAMNNGNTYAISNANAYTDEKVGDIESALIGIIAIQNSLIGGEV